MALVTLPKPQRMTEVQQAIYDQLWHEASAAFAKGHLQVDQSLANPQYDLRRGVTLVFRPPPAIQARVKAFLDEVAGIFPGQYFYRPDELHATVLSIISGTEHWRSEIRHLRNLRLVIQQALSGQNAVEFSFQGITASPAAVLIQGFPQGAGLEAIRGKLRTALTQHGYGHFPDRRYKIRAAHMTAVRFRQPKINFRQMQAALEKHRRTEFGTATIAQIDLIFSDWYASAGTMRILQRYPLRAG